MTLCRTIADVEAQADADSIGEPPLSQEAADRVAGRRGFQRADARLCA